MNTTEVGTSATAEPSPIVSRNVIGAAVGTLTEYYDFAIYGLVAPAIATEFFPHGNPTTATLSTFAIFALAFVTRPIGGVVFGYLGDRVGRKSVLAVSILLMAVSTAAIGVLPTYETVGLLAPVLLLICRCLQSLSVGGEFSGASSYLAETVPAHKRGTYASMVTAAAGLPFIFAIAIILPLSASLDDAAFNSWGWRVPFLLAAPLGLFGLYIRMKLEESAAFTELKASGSAPRNPLLTGIRTQWRKMILVFCAAAVTASAYYIFSAYMVTYVTSTLHYGRDTALMINGVATAFLCAGILLAGRASDRFGRRPVIATGLAGLVILGVPSFLLLQTGSTAALLLGQTVFALCIAPVTAVVPTLASELFPTSVRYSCNALSYNLAYTVFGGTAPFIAAWLISTTSLKIAPAIYASTIAFLGAIVILGRLKETRGTALHQI
ncbi:MFS transporter [Nocardia sp. CA-119907]|uniref:MFS transporter n=1 Tax=Nocardia sp. CA-119907 TaxID=3239973 RepID=UPI003D9837BE